MKIETLFVFAAIALVSLSVSAQRPDRWHATESPIVLARMGLLEAGEEVLGTELAAMRQVIEHRASRGGANRSFQSTAWAFSHALRNPRKAWVHSLDRRPLRSARIRAIWERIVADADAVFAGSLEHNCVDESGNVVALVDWGGPHVDRGSLDSLSRVHGWRSATTRQNEGIVHP